MRRALALLALAVLLTLAACSTAKNGIEGTGAAGPATVTSPAPSPSSSSPASHATSAAAPSPWPGWPSYLPDPHKRMLLGAFVQLSGEPSTEAAVRARERAMGRSYDMEVTYYDWTDPFPDLGESVMAAHGRTPVMAWYGPDKVAGSGNTLADIVSGADDAWITKQADAIKAFGFRVFLRLMPEMNGNWYGYSGDPPKFVAAWRHVYDVFKRAGVTNVTWLWCPNLTPESNWDAYYPGNGYVDMIGVDAFSNTTYTWQTFQGLFGRFFAHFAELTRHKPQLVVETATNSGAGSKAAGIGSAAEYISGMAKYLRTVAGPKYGVIGVCWFDSDTSDRHNWRVDQTKAAWRAWLAMARAPYFGGPG